MRFLCLHGQGTNCLVLETQTAPIRQELDEHHEFEFVQGTLSHPISAQIKNFYPSTDEYFEYYKVEPNSILQSLSQLHDYIEEEGPFDGVLGFSQGACLAATYLLKFAVEQPGKLPPFRCAVFLSSSVVFDPQALVNQKIRRASDNPALPGLGIPTAHMWGRKDVDARDDCEILWNLCKNGTKERYLHDGGHEVPSVRAKEDVQGCVKAIRRAIDKAEHDQ